jgi:hypothetical protein
MKSAQSKQQNFMPPRVAAASEECGMALVIDIQAKFKYNQS